MLGVGSWQLGQCCARFFLASNFHLLSPICDMIQPWKKIRSTLIGDFRIFKLRSDVKISPRTGKEHDFYVLDSVDWVNVIAVTPDQKLVMVEQYRHGSKTVELEVPGGMMDPQE